MTEQLTLDLSGIPTARNILECVASGVYQRGLTRVAGLIDTSPSHLSEALSGSDRRKFDLMWLDKYIEATGDTSVIRWLIDKHMRTDDSKRLAAIAQLKDLGDQMAKVLGEIAPTPKRSRK